MSVPAIHLPSWNEPKNLIEAKRTIGAFGRSLHEHAYLLGKNLLWVKTRIGRGGFDEWIDDNVAFGRRTTYYLMAFSRRCDQAGLIQEYHPNNRATVARLDGDNGTNIVEDLGDLTAQGSKYRTIYVDPPWPYTNRATRAAATNHYRTMSLDEISALPVVDVAMPEAHLHLWTTNAFLRDALDVMGRWGFEYKSCFVWVKPEMGIGNYWRVSHEFLLFGLRGRLPFQNRAAKSWMELSRGQHSRKPDQVRDLIESVSPLPRLELFGRRRIEGWSVVGNQIDMV